MARIADAHPAVAPLLAAIDVLADYKPAGADDRERGADLARLVASIAGLGDGTVNAAGELADTTAHLVRTHLPAHLQVADQRYAVEATAYWADVHTQGAGEDLGNAAVHALQGSAHPAGEARDFYADFGIDTGEG